MSAVGTWRRYENQYRPHSSSIGSAQDVAQTREVAASPPAFLDEMVPQQGQGAVKTDHSLGLLLVPVAICVALLVYASMFFS